MYIYVSHMILIYDDIYIYLGHGGWRCTKACKRPGLALGLVVGWWQVATKALPPREGSGRELVVRHIPSSWGQQAGVRLSQALPGIGQAIYATRHVYS